MSQTDTVKITTGTQISWTASETVTVETSENVTAQIDAKAVDKAVVAVDAKKPREEKKQRRQSLKK
jgi:hypothetical protein